MQAHISITREGQVITEGTHEAETAAKMFFSELDRVGYAVGADGRTCAMVDVRVHGRTVVRSAAPEGPLVGVVWTFEAPEPLGLLDEDLVVYLAREYFDRDTWPTHEERERESL